MLKVTIMTEPVAKGRPKVTTSGGFARAYTPAKTRNAEQMIQALIREEVLKHERIESGVPLRLDVTFFREKPKSLSKKVTMPVSRPDTDNYLKLLLDACNGYLFPDDAQITSITACKRFGSPARIELRIEEDRDEIEIVYDPQRDRLL